MSGHSFSVGNSKSESFGKHFGQWPDYLLSGWQCGAQCISRKFLYWSTGASAQSVTVDASGNYSVTVTDANGCQGTASQSVTVNQNPSVSISANGPTTFCQGGSVVLSASSGSSYNWSTGASAQSVTVDASGNYSVAVTDANGCQGTASQSVTVNQNPSVSISANGQIGRASCRER